MGRGGLAAAAVWVGLAGLTALGQAGGEAGVKPATRPVVDRIPNTTVYIEMVQVPGGKITLKDEKGKETTHIVKPFLMQKTEATWDQWDVMYLSLDLPPKKRDTEGRERLDALLRPSSKPYLPPDNGWGRQGSPAINLTLHAVRAYIKWLNETTGRKYRLPTEAEWEWACRAGADKPLAPAREALEKVAWVAENAEDHTHPVGKKAPNAWGLYDMLGNAAEYVIRDRDDKKGLAAGGSWNDEAKDVHSGAREPYVRAVWQQRDKSEPPSIIWLSDGGHVGFRLVRDVEADEKDAQ